MLVRKFVIDAQIKIVIQVPQAWKSSRHSSGSRYLWTPWDWMRSKISLKLITIHSLLSRNMCYAWNDLLIGTNLEISKKTVQFDNTFTISIMHHLSFNLPYWITVKASGIVGEAKILNNDNEWITIWSKKGFNPHIHKLTYSQINLEFVHPGIHYV